MKSKCVSKKFIFISLLVCVCKTTYSQNKQYCELKLDNSTAILSSHELLFHPSLESYSMNTESFHYSKSKSKNIFIKEKIDSIRNTLINDSVSSELIYIDIDYLDKNAYGCIIAKNEGKINGREIKLVNSKENIFLIDSKSIKSASKTINELFFYPNQFIENFLPNTVHQLSHDNEMYFFLKVNGKILFDKYFMRSSFLNTSNEKAKELIILLGGLYSSH
jgi:hypothetical protein